MGDGVKRFHSSLRCASALALIATLAGCAGPTDADVAADFTRLHPGCTLLRTVGGTDSNDRWSLASNELLIDIDFKCQDETSSDSFVYRKDDHGAWKLAKSAQMLATVAEVVKPG